MSELAGRVALVTGAAGGIGRAVVQRLADAGATVVATTSSDMPDAELESAVAGRGMCHALDVTDERAWARVIEAVEVRHGPLQCLVNVAGYFKPGETIEQTSLVDWRRHFAINVDGSFLGCRFGIESMKKSGRGGSIVNVSSGLAWKRMPEAFAYSVSKGAILHLTQQAALQAARHRIRVNAMLPGAIETPMMYRNLREGQLPHQLVEAATAQHPIGRIGQPGDVADLVEFLCSDRSAFITGACIPIDGGQTL
jgi:NAD(P)-dependent dehydrogenase (short-subunit alcohol dehydrogenase family)